MTLLYYAGHHHKALTSSATRQCVISKTMIYLQEVSMTPLQETLTQVTGVRGHLMISECA